MATKVATMISTHEEWNPDAEQLRSGGPRVRAWLAALQVLGIPVPREQCNGTWRVPVWDPDSGWEASTMETSNASYARPVTLAACGDRECTALHLEEYVSGKLAGTKRRLLAARARRRSTGACAGGVR